MEFDLHLAVMALIGGFIFGTSLIVLMFDSHLPLPPLRSTWMTYVALSTLFFITYYGAIYANRLIDGDDIFHSTPISLIAYVSFNIGMLISSVVEEFRRKRKNGIKG